MIELENLHSLPCHATAIMNPALAAMRNIITLKPKM